MQPTVYQKPEIRDANDNIIQQGAFGKNTALANATNDGWIDYVANDLEFLYDLAKDEVVPVPSLPASGQMNKTYLLTTTGVSYRWSGTQWVAVSSSEAVGRAESAALLAEQWATKTDGTVDGTEYSAKYYAEQAQQSADDAQDTADDMADHLVQIDKNTGGVAKNSKRISNIEKLLQGNLYDYDTDDDTAYVKTVPSGALPYAGIEQIGGKTLVWNQLVNSGATTVATISGHKYYTLIDGTASIVTSDGTAISIVDDTTDMVCDLTLMFGSGKEPATTDAFTDIFPGTHYPYNAGTLLSAGVTEVKSVGINLFDPNAITDNVYLSTTTGLPESNSRYFTTDYIPVYAGQTVYIPNTWTLRRWFYDTNKTPTTYLENSAVQYYTPTQAGFIRVSVDKNQADINALIIAYVTSNTPPTYVPYNGHSYPIPSAIQQLDGYGWSAGNVYNYVDFERKVFVKCVNRVDLGSKTWTASGSHYYTLLQSYIKENNNPNIASNILCQKYVTKSFNDLTEYTTPCCSMYPYNVQIYDSAYADATALKTALNGVYLYYELATPIETDISAYLTDNLIEVGAGGTLTFENSNGNDYHIPVQSTETYMIDLQSAIGE